MTLQRKTLLIIGLTLAGLLGVLYVVSHLVLLRSFAELEEENARRNLDRAVSAVTDDLSDLDLRLIDYAEWDQTYAFMHGGLPKYPDTEFPMATFPRLRFSIVLILDNSGRVVLAKAFNLAQRREIEVPRSLLGSLSSGSPLLKLPDTESRVMGIIAVEGEPTLVVSRPILTSKAEGPIAGTLIMGRPLDSGEVGRMAQISHLSLSAYRFDDSQLPGDFREARASLSEQTPNAVRPLGPDSIAAYSVLRDLYGKPAVILRVDLPRAVYQQGRTSVLDFMLLLLLAGLVFGWVTLFLLQKVVLFRITNLSANVAGIASSGDLSARVSQAGEDEIANLAGEINRMLGSLERNEKEHKLLEQQFRQAQKMEAVGRLAGGVAHDFNNLLMVIQGYIELMLGRLDPADTLRKSAAEIKKAADRAASLTRQLLAFSRMQVLQPKLLDLNSVVAETGKMLRRLIGEDVELLLVPGGSLGTVRADQSQLEQVILNLAVNARDAMPQGGRLTIETANVELDEAYARQHAGVQPGEYVMLAVSDTGVGMDAETQAHIFEPFFTTKGVGKGTGLGLATVYGVVKQSGGWIWVYSEKGRGTTFKIYLPRVHEAKPDEVRESAGTSRGGSETILLVEDEDGVRKLALEFLTSRGYTVLGARDGFEALQIAERQPGPIHLLITDVVMPGMSGPELAQQVFPLRPHIKTLYMSGYTDYAMFDHRKHEKVTVSLQKPFPLEALARIVREALDDVGQSVSPVEEATH